MSLGDWHSMSLVRRGHLVHLATDPACIFFRPPKPGSRLDRASRGLSCPRCMTNKTVPLSTPREVSA